MSPSKIIIIAVVFVALLGVGVLKFQGRKSQDPRDQASLPQGLAPTLETFTDEIGRFSFQYPKEFLVTTQSMGDFGDAILVRDPQSKLEIQIAIFAFDEDEALIRERILLDLPDMIIEKEQNVLIGEKKDISALLFSSSDPDVGNTKEVWFARAGFLYQVSTLAENEVALGTFLEKWYFNNR